MKKLLAFLLLSAVVSCAFADRSKPAANLYNFKGSHLSDSCVDGYAERRGLCLGYINGVAVMQKKACIPSKAKFGKLKRVVESYMEDNKDQLNQDAFKVVVAAFADRWPCR
jgi:hypothetical protein